MSETESIRVQLDYPLEHVKEPIIYHLVTDYSLVPTSAGPISTSIPAACWCCSWKARAKTWTLASRSCAASVSL